MPKKRKKKEKKAYQMPKRVFSVVWARFCNRQVQHVIFGQYDLS